jgi:hypothetical protein
MAKQMKGSIIGQWAFVVGVIVAVIVGIIAANQGGAGAGWTMALVVIGLIVGLLNVSDEETAPFLMSGVVLIIASALGGNQLGTIPYAGEILSALLAIFVPATIIVAIKNVFSIAKH